MFKKLITLFTVAVALHVHAQDASVEKSIFGIQAGPVGIWANNERKLSNHFALRSEIGAILGVVTLDYAGNEKTHYIVVPEISAAPRWYYNLERRSGKGKNIKNNSGNFVAVKANFQLFLKSDDNPLVVNELAIVPQWGIRRVYGKHLSFETGIGLGPIFYFGPGADIVNKDDVYVDVHLRIGYSF